jgi:hypothetical protein
VQEFWRNLKSEGFGKQSFLPELSKDLERLICDQFIDNPESDGLLSPYQSGFQKFRSTAIMTKIMYDIHLGLERLGFSIPVQLDFSEGV